jgi:RHS repeat-associated protein
MINDNPELFQYYYHSDHLGSTSVITNLDGELVQHVEYVPFGEVFIEERNNKWNTPYLFNAKELDEETGLYYYGARYYDPRTSVWLSTDPLQEKYPEVSTYAYCVNNPVNAIDPNGKDVIFMIDKKSAEGNGHIAVLVGNENNGWTYVSINGTGGKSKPYGESKNADVGTPIIDDDGNLITDPMAAIQRANTINPEETHSYDAFSRIASSADEDKNAIEVGGKTASTERYGIAGPGKSCIDVAQDIFGSIVKDRGLDNKGKVPGQSDLIPNNWFSKLSQRVTEVNKNATNSKANQSVLFVPYKRNK